MRQKKFELKKLRRILACSLLAVLLLTTFVTPVSAQGDGQETYKQLLQKIDGSVSTLRKGGDPSESLSMAKRLYENFVKEFESEGPSNNLHNRIVHTFDDLIREGENAREENIRSLRSDISQMANELGVDLPFVYKNSMFVILGISIVLSLMITLINKHTVDWEKVKQARAMMKTWQKELRDAYREKDMKRVHKLRMEQKDVMQAQQKVMMATLKPMIFYFVPLMLVFWLLRDFYGGWVVAWLPFNLPLPFYGTMASMGFLSWYFITYLGFAQLWRRFLIGD